MNDAEPGEELMCAKRAVVMLDVVDVSSCIVFGGGLAGATTAAVGGAFAPIVIVAQMASKGGSSSGAIVKRGESHRTIEEGSSNLMIRLSKLCGSARALSFLEVERILKDLRCWLVRALAPLIVPFPT